MNVTTGIYKETLAELWNTSFVRQFDHKYEIPVVTGDVLSFQTHFQNSVLDWGNHIDIECYTSQGVLLSASYTGIAVGAKTGGNAIDGVTKYYQNVNISTNLIKDSFAQVYKGCFYFKIHCTTLNETVYTEMYTNLVSEDDTVLLEMPSDTEYDAYGNYYGDWSYTWNTYLTNNEFIPKMRVYGNTKRMAGTTEKQTFNSAFSNRIMISNSIVDEVKLSLSKRVPYFVLDEIRKKYFVLSKVIVDGEEYNSDSLAIENTVPVGASRMFFFNLILKQNFYFNKS